MNENGILNEYGVIGSLLKDSSLFPEVAGELSGEDFSFAPTRAMFEAMARQYGEQRRFDAITIRDDAARKCPEIDNRFLYELLDITPTAANLDAYVRLMKEASLRRKLGQLGEELTDPTVEPLEALGRAQEVLEKLSRSAVCGETETIGAALDPLFDRVAAQGSGKPACVQTGLTGFDRLLGGGLINGGFHVLAARPAVGKSAVALQIALNAARHGVRVLYVSLEMDSEDCTARLVGNQGGISPTRLMMGGKLTDEEYNRLAEASVALNRLPISFNRRAFVRVQQLESMVRRERAGLLVIDHLGLLEPPEKQLSLYEATTRNSRALKLLALKLKIPVLCLCQLNRAAASERDGTFRATMANLRESGAIEQDADTVTLLHAPPVETDGRPETPSLLELHVDKNRRGRTGTAEATFYKYSGIVTC